jgi:hypothetical protein
MDNTTEVVEQSAPTELDPVANLDEANPDQATAAEGAGDQPQEQAEQQEAKPPKTFSQEEVDALIQKRLVKEARRSERVMAQKLAEIQGQQKPVTPEPKREDFANDEAHQRAQLDHVIRTKAEEIAAQKFWERADDVADRFPDFQSAVSDPTLPLTQSMADFAFESEVGPELVYHLSKNRGKASSIAQMGPMQAARALMTLESELKAKPKAQPSRAPDPINPVGNRGSASRSSMPSDEDDVDTWRRKETERMRRAGLIR